MSRIGTPSVARGTYEYANAGLIPVLSRAIAIGQGLGTVDYSGTSIIVHKVLATSHGLVLEYRNAYQGTDGTVGGIETPGTGTITVKENVEYPAASGLFFPVYFGGQRTGTVMPGATLRSDVLSIDMTAGTSLATRTHAVPASGASLITGFARTNTATATEGTNAFVVGGADRSDNGTVTSVAANVFGISAGLATPVGVPPVVGALGDSITVGATDTPTDYGWFSRALEAATIPHQRLSIAAERAQGHASPFRRQIRSRLLDGCTDIVCALGVNDFRNSRTLAQCQADLITVWTMAAYRAARVWQTTITPSTSSTDAWATTGNQTAHANDLVRRNLNGWIRAGAPILAGAAVAIGTGGALLAGATGHPLAGYFELADTVETARDSGIWKAPSWTADGVHPLAAGHTAMAAAIDTTRFLSTRRRPT